MGLGETISCQSDWKGIFEWHIALVFAFNGGETRSQMCGTVDSYQRGIAIHFADFVLNQIQGFAL